jgi:hypothetical protein
MEIEIGDIFKHGRLLFKVIEKIDFFNIRCNVFYDKRIVATSNEHTNNLLRMKKISSLEKELM